jgi:hypothetical protein
MKLILLIALFSLTKKSNGQTVSMSLKSFKLESKSYKYNNSISKKDTSYITIYSDKILIVSKQGKVAELYDIKQKNSTEENGYLLVNYLGIINGSDISIKLIYYNNPVNLNGTMHEGNLIIQTNSYELTYSLTFKD